jgi:hypothetical protein
MTPRVPDSPLHRIVSGQYAALRRALVLRHALGAAGRAAALLAIAVGVGVLWPSGEALAWARAAAVLTFVIAALGLALAGFHRARPSFAAYLERIEQSFPVVRSWLRNALDFESRPPQHTSPELAQALSAETARRLADVPLATLRPPIGARRPLAAMALALAVVAGLGLLLPARTERSWRTLLDPRRAAPPMRLEVEPGSVTVTPGVALAVRAHVWGTAARPRLLRDGAPALEGTREGEGNAGERLWRFDLTQLTRALDYRVRVATAESPRYRIALTGTPQPVSFEIEIHPPAYAQLPVQRGAATRGDLSALRGSRALIEVLFDRDLASLEASAPGAAPRGWRPVNPRRWRGEIAIRKGGEYELHARASAAGGPAGEGRYRYSVQPLADAPPVLTVRVPEGDQDLPAGEQVPYDVLGQDDLGLTELRLQVRKDPDAPWTNVTLAHLAGVPREAQLGARWDANSLGLLPGQSATFRFQLFDDNAVDGRGVATSPAYELRFPSLTDLYQSLDQRQASVQDALEKVSDRAQELQKSLDRLSRQAPTPAAGSPQSYERQEEVKSALERQQDLTQRIDQASSELRESLQQAAERRAFDDQLTRKLRELAEIMDQIQSKDFKDAMKRLQEALENLERRPSEPALQDWRRQNEQLLKNLERTLQLLKQLRQEEQLQALAQRAQELKAQQDERNPRLAGKPPGDAERQQQAADALRQEQERAAEASEQLAKDTQELSRQMSEPQAAPGLEQVAEELQSEAAPAQREAAQAASRSQRNQAGKAGQRASESLERVAAQLGQISSALQQAREQLDLAAVRRSAQDLVSLQRAAEASLDAASPTGERSDRQQDLAEGTSRVADSLATLAQKTPFLSQQMSEALGQAINGFQRSSRQYQQGDRSGGEQAGRDASSALVQAVLQLRQTENSMCKNPGGSQPGGTIPERMTQMGEGQRELNDRTGSLAQRLSEQVRLSSGDRDEVRRLAEEQARLHDELRQIEEQDRQRHQLLGRLDKTADEMKEVEEALRQGQLGDEVEQKQQHILSRLLDAQRSVNRQDFDPRRESRPGEDVARSSPPGLPADLLRESDRLRLGLLKAQADRYPAQYRAFIEAYLRALNSGSAR